MTTTVRGGHLSGQVSALPPNSLRQMIEHPEQHTTFEWVPLERMFVDRYGRELSEHKLKDMVSNWNLREAGALYVSLRDDGRYATLDGGHRCAAGRQLGLKRLPSLVYHDLNYQQETLLYRAFNHKRLNMSALGLFKAALEGADPMAIDINAVVETQGLCISFDKMVRPGGVLAVRAMETIYRTYGRQQLVEVMALAYDSWGTSDPRAYSEAMLQGLAAFWIRRELFDVRPIRSEVVKRLADIGASGLMQKSRMLQTATIGMDPATAVGQTIMGVYDHKRQAAHRLGSWPSRVSRQSRLRNRGGEDVEGG